MVLHFKEANSYNIRVLNEHIMVCMCDKFWSIFQNWFILAVFTRLFGPSFYTDHQQIDKQLHCLCFPSVEVMQPSYPAVILMYAYFDFFFKSIYCKYKHPEIVKKVWRGWWKKRRRIESHTWNLNFFLYPESTFFCWQQLIRHFCLKMSS